MEKWIFIFNINRSWVKTKWQWEKEREKIKNYSRTEIQQVTTDLSYLLLSLYKVAKWTDNDNANHNMPIKLSLNFQCDENSSSSHQNWCQFILFTMCLWIQIEIMSLVERIKQLSVSISSSPLFLLISTIDRFSKENFNEFRNKVETLRYSKNQMETVTPLLEWRKSIMAKALMIIKTPSAAVIFCRKFESLGTVA